MAGVFSTQQQSEMEDVIMMDVSPLPQESTPQTTSEYYAYTPMDISPLPTVKQAASQLPPRPRFVTSVDSPNYPNLDQPLPRILSPMNPHRPTGLMTGPLTRSPYIRPLHRFSPKSRPRAPNVSSFLTMPSQSRDNSTTNGPGMLGLNNHSKGSWPAVWNASSSRDSSFNSLQTDTSALTDNYKGSSFESVTSFSTAESSVSRKRSIDDGISLPAQHPSPEADSRLSTKYRRVSGHDFPASATIAESPKSGAPSPPAQNLSAPANEGQVSGPIETSALSAASPLQAGVSTVSPSTPVIPSVAHRNVIQRIPGMWPGNSPASATRRSASTSGSRDLPYMSGALPPSSPAVPAAAIPSTMTDVMGAHDGNAHNDDPSNTTSSLYNALGRYTMAVANGLKTVGTFARRAIGYLQQRYRGHTRRSAARASPVHPNFRAFSEEQRRRLREQQRLRERGLVPVQEFPFPDLSNIPSFPTVISPQVSPTRTTQSAPAHITQFSPTHISQSSPTAAKPSASRLSASTSRRSSLPLSNLAYATHNKYFRKSKEPLRRPKSPSKDGLRKLSGVGKLHFQDKKAPRPVSPKISPSVKRRMGLVNQRNAEALRRAYMFQVAMHTSDYVPTDRQLALMATVGDIPVPKSRTSKPKKNVHFGEPIAEYITESGLFTELAPHLHPSSPNVQQVAPETEPSELPPSEQKPLNLVEQKENVPPTPEAPATPTEEADEDSGYDSWTKHPYPLGRAVSAVRLFYPNPQPLPPGRTESIYASEWKKIQEEEKNKERPARIRPEGPAVRPLSAKWDNKLKEVLAMPNGRKIARTPDGEELSKRDLATCFTPAAWLNDQVINGYLGLIVEYMRRTNGNAGRHDKPRFHAFNSFFFSNLRDKGYASVSRWAKRAKIGGQDLLNVDTVLVPVHNHSHWTLIVVKPMERTIENFDSLGTVSQRHVAIIKDWLRNELGDTYVEDEWTVLPSVSPQQNNGSDCGAFLLSTAKALAIGLEPLSYGARDITLLRRKIVAELMAGALEGDFDPVIDGEALL